MSYPIGRQRRGRIPSFAELDATPRKSLAQQRGAIRRDGYKGEAMHDASPREILANRLALAVKRGGQARLFGRRQKQARGLSLRK